MSYRGNNEYRGGRSGGYENRGGGSSRGGRSSGYDDRYNNDEMYHDEYSRRGGRSNRGGPYRRHSYNKTLNNTNRDRGHRFGEAKSGCGNYVLKGNCERGDGCRYSHMIRKVGDVTEKESVRDIALWIQNSQLFSCCDNDNIQLWNCSTWELITSIHIELPLPTNAVAKANIDRSARVKSIIVNNNWLFFAFEALQQQGAGVYVGYIRAWNLTQTQRLPYEFYFSPTMMHSHSWPITTLAACISDTSSTIDMSPTIGDDVTKVTLFSGDESGNITMWTYDATVDQFKAMKILEGHAREITKLIVTDVDGAPTLISASKDGIIKIWNNIAENPQCLAGFPVMTEEAALPITDAIIWKHQGQSYLITSGLDLHVVVWSLSAPYSQLAKEKQESCVTAMCETVDQEGHPILLLGFIDGSILLKSLPTLENKVYLSASHCSHRDTVKRIIPGPPSTFLSASVDKQVIAWQMVANIQDEKR